MNLIVSRIVMSIIVVSTNYRVDPYTPPYLALLQPDEEERTAILSQHCPEI
jgi:hypothetical protein